MGMIKDTGNEALLPLLFADIDAIKIMHNDSNGSIVGCELIDPAIHVTSSFGIKKLQTTIKNSPSRYQ